MEGTSAEQIIDGIDVQSLLEEEIKMEGSSAEQSIESPIVYMTSSFKMVQEGNPGGYYPFSKTMVTYFIGAVHLVEMLNLQNSVTGGATFVYKMTPEMTQRVKSFACRNKRLAGVSIYINKDYEVMACGQLCFIQEQLEEIKKELEQTYAGSTWAYCTEHTGKWKGVRKIGEPCTLCGVVKWDHQLVSAPVAKKRCVRQRKSAEKKSEMATTEATESDANAAVVLQ